MSDKIKFIVSLEQCKITNYYQIVANLKRLQQKNNKYLAVPVKTEFRNILKPVYKDISVDCIINEFVDSKLQENILQYEKRVDQQFLHDLKIHINSIKNQNKALEKFFKKNFSISQIEHNFNDLPTEEMFNDPLLFDIYTFLRTTAPSIDFDQEVTYLGIEYIKYIDRFLMKNSSDVKVPLKNFEDKVATFVKLKYSSQEYDLEVYEGRYIFAEIYICLRCNATGAAYALFDKYSSFFSNTDQELKKKLSSWIHSKETVVIDQSNLRSGDKFKRCLYDLMQGKVVVEDHFVISTIEDYLWIQLINMKSDKQLNIFKKQFQNYQGRRGLFLTYVMTKQYNEAIEFILNNNFATLATYYTLKELVKRVSTKSAFEDFTFFLCTKIRNTQHKLDCISGLNGLVEDYEECIAKNIVKYKLFDVLGHGLSKNIELYVIKYLKNINDRKQLIKVYKHVDDLSILIEILTDIFIEGIITGLNIDDSIKIYLDITNKSESINLQKLDVLYKFYQFMQDPNIYTLKKTSFFSIDFKLVEVKIVIEKVLKTACKIIIKANDREMARGLFKIVGEIELSTDCVKYLNKELIALI